MSVKVAVILSGCGFLDGAEIHEAVMTLYALQKLGAKTYCFAPDIDQRDVVNHLTGEIARNEKRNVLVESARIARGQIQDIAAFDPEQFAAMALPGGFGAAKNLSSFAVDGAACIINPDVENAIKGMIKRNKPVAALCISPAVVARLYTSPTLTIGQDVETASTLVAMGARHETTGHGEVVVDRANKLVTTPCYMLDATVPDIASGAENAMEVLLTLIDD
ncbi:isoprenoid biosynthesis glyoxalase ElbB [Kiloniella laminariae]|uniref:isoprenoid biosynthesis glyoxalase ElbB n=1 Tax=Kiloniella laminariae TaxID=454162 RepID=UPI000363F13C|nr:isoprenoid biosynthesis glyoxalase ElbB [Kiloniella laminariae]